MSKYLQSRFNFISALIRSVRNVRLILGSIFQIILMDYFDKISLLVEQNIRITIVCQ